MERMEENVARLYEIGAPSERIEAYFHRWWRWVKGGISEKWLSGFPSRDTLRLFGMTQATCSGEGGLGEHLVRYLLFLSLVALSFSNSFKPPHPMT